MKIIQYFTVIKITVVESSIVPWLPIIHCARVTISGVPVLIANGSCLIFFQNEMCYGKFAMGKLMAIEEQRMTSLTSHVYPFSVSVRVLKIPTSSTSAERTVSTAALVTSQQPTSRTNIHQTFTAHAPSLQSKMATVTPWFNSRLYISSSSMTCRATIGWRSSLQTTGGGCVAPTGQL